MRKRDMQPTSPLRRLFSSVSFWIFAGTFFVRLLVLSRFSGSAHFIPHGDDMAFYNGWAMRILEGQFTDGRAFYGLPGYAWVLAGLYAVFGVNFFMPSLLQAAMEGITGVCMYRLGVLSFASKSRNFGRIESFAPHAIGIVASVGWIVFLPTQVFSIILMPTAWLVCAFWFCVWRLAELKNTTIMRPWLGYGVFMGLIAMMIATILCLIPLFFVAIGRTVGAERLKWSRLGRGLAAAAVLIAGILIGTSPAWIHNYFVAREPVFLTAHSGINEWIGNNPEATGYPRMPPGIRASQEGLLRDSISVAEIAEGRELTRAEVSAHWSTKAREWRREHFSEWVQLVGVKFANFWNAYQYDDLSIIKLLQAEGVVFAGLRFGVVAALALPGLVFGIWRHRRSRWVAAAVLLHMAVVMTVFVTERYRLAAVPGLLIFAAYALVQFWQWLMAGRHVACAGWGAATALAAVFVSIPRDDRTLWSLDPYKVGIRAFEAAEIFRRQGEEARARVEQERAQENLETAFAYVPNSAEINFALGNLWYTRGGVERAKLYYGRTLEFLPRHTGALNNLGVMALEGKRPEDAEMLFAEAVKIDPENAKSHYLLALARFERGDLPGARVALTEALRRSGERREFQELAAKLAAREDQR